MFIAKADVRQARLTDVPKASQLNFYRRASDRATFDPYAVLKIDRNATSDQIKQAYHKMTQIYHPDRLWRLLANAVRGRQETKVDRVLQEFSIKFRASTKSGAFES